MTLPVSPNSISLSQVNTELGLSSTAQISLNNSAVRSLFGVASGAISMSQGYGKANQFAFNLTAGANVDLRSQAVAAGWNGTSKVVATLASGTVYSNSTGSAAMTISGSFPNGVQFINSGLIVGRGGNGGASGAANGQNAQANGNPGAGAGPALLVSTAVTITNNSTIAGGGGGGGGGVSYNNAKSGVYYGGGGGGGGIGGSTGGAGGSGSNGGTTIYGAVGGAGTTTAAGGGGSSTAPAGGGGAGGSYGSVGSVGLNGGFTSGGGGAGAAGACTSGNANISWLATGTRYGALN